MPCAAAERPVTDKRGISTWRCVPCGSDPACVAHAGQTGAAFWSVLLVPQYPIMQDILDFINVGPW